MIPKLGVKKWSAIVAASVFVLAYVCDFIYLRIRVAYPRLGQAYGTMVVPRVLAFPMKNGRMEYDLDADNPETTVTCAHSLFPQPGYKPCWYVVYKSRQPVSMEIVLLPNRFLQ